MLAIEYEWKVDFAIIVALFSLCLTVGLSILQNRAKRRLERIRAYEAIYEDVSFVLEYPFRKRESIAKGQLYSSEDPGLQAAVRAFRNAHWMNQMWGTSRFIPEGIENEHEKYEFLERVTEESRKFDEELFSFRIGLNLAERSPVYHLDNLEVAERLGRVMKHVGHNLSLFSHNIRRAWESAKFKDPQDIKTLYEQCIDVCANFFEHNPRDFEDPFHDLLEAVRQEYRTLTRRKKEVFVWGLQRNWFKVRHPIMHFKVRR